MIWTAAREAAALHKVEMYQLLENKHPADVPAVVALDHSKWEVSKGPLVILVATLYQHMI